MSVKHILMMFCAGGLGTLSRFGLSALITKLAGGPFPLGVFVVNILGCFLFGFIWELVVLRQAVSEYTRIILLTGFTGAFTTFSTFIFDSFILYNTKLAMAALNVIGQVVIGFLFLYLGIKTMRIMLA